MPHRTVTPQKSRPNFGDVGTLMIQVEVTHKKDHCSTELSFWLRTNPQCCILPIFEGRKVTLMDKLNDLGRSRNGSGMSGMPRCYARLPREGLWQDPLAASCRWARQFKATHCSMFWKGHTEEIAHCGCPVAMLGWNCIKSIIVHAKSKSSIKENQAR